MKRLSDFIRNLADPIARPDKFRWATLPGDPPQVFGKSLDMKARLYQDAASQFQISIISRDGKKTDLGPFKNEDSAKAAAETHYSTWIEASKNCNA